MFALNMLGVLGAKIGEKVGVRNIAVALAAWFLLEIFVFIFVARSIGLFVALLLASATSLLGLADIRRLLDYLKRRATGAGAGSESGLVDGGLQALGSLLLIVPGFVSDFVGLALKSPSVRAGLAQRVKDKPVDPRIIDLAPGEWRRDKPKRAPRKRAAPKADSA